MTNLETAIELERQPSFFEWIIRRRVFVMMLTVLLTLGVSAGMEKLQFSSDYRDFFDADNPKLAAFEALQDKFVRTNNVYIAVESHYGNIFTAENLSLLSRLTTDLWKLPYVIRVDSVANYQFLTAKGDEILINDLTTGGGLIDDQFASSFHKSVLLEKGLKDYLAVEDPSLTGVNISLSDAVNTEGGKLKFMSALQALLGVYADQKINTYLTGSVVVDHGFDVAAQQDVETLYGIVYLLMFALAWFLTRSLAAIFGVMLVVTFSWLIALGVAGWVGIKLTAISVSAPTVLMTVAVAQSMHILFSIQKRRVLDIDIKSAVQQAMQSNILPLFLVSLSTTVGFLSIMTSEVPPLQDLGFILAIGALSVFLLATTFLPAFLSLFSLQAKSYMRASEQSMERLGCFVSRHVWLFLSTGLLATLLLLMPVTYNKINDNFIEYFDKDNSVRKDSEYINEHMTGIHHIYFELESNGKYGIFKKEYLSYLDDLTNWLERQPEVSHVSSYSDVLKRLNRASYGDKKEAYRLPDNSNTASQLHLLYEMSLPLGLTTRNFVDIKQHSTRLSLVLNNISSAEMLALEKRINDWHLKKGGDIKLHPGTGPSLMFADIGQRNSESLITSTLIAMLLVSVILVVALRNIKLSLVSLIPNLIPAVMAFGIWGLYDGDVGLAISIVVVMTFGIIVDDTIYILIRFKQNIDRGSFAKCLAYTFREVGKPIVNTTIILSCGFLVLAFSNFRLNQGMGMLTALVIFIALLWDMFILPGLIKLFIYQDKGAMS